MEYSRTHQTSWGETKKEKKGLNFIKQHKNGVIEKVIRWNAA